MQVLSLTEPESLFGEKEMGLSSNKICQRTLSQKSRWDKQDGFLSSNS